MQDTAQIKQSRSSNVMWKMLKTDLISLNRCLGWLSLLSTARWWSSRFEPQEAHELTHHQKAPWHRGHAKPRQTAIYLFIFHKSYLVAQFWHSTTRSSNLSAPACESGQQLSAYKTSRRGNPRAQAFLLQLNHYNTASNRSHRSRAKTPGRRATLNPKSEWHVWFAPRECVQKISCHLSIVAARFRLPTGTQMFPVWAFKINYSWREPCYEPFE